MKKFKIIKKENEIMELCIAYGISKILDDNRIDWVMTNKKAYFLIETEQEFDYEDIIFSPLMEDDLWSINSSLNRTEKLGRMKSINEFLDKPKIMNMIFQYYETNDESVVAKISKLERATYCGTCFYTKGIRNNATPKANTVRDFENNLSLLGFIVSTTYCKTDFEVNLILFPKKINSIQRPYNWTYVQKETGDVKYFTYFGSSVKTIVNANIYLKTLKKFKSDSMIGNYEKILYMQLTPTVNKPMADTNFFVPILDISIDLCEKLIQKIEHSAIGDNVKIVTSDFILNTSYTNFSKLVQLYAKKNEMIDNNSLEELIQLQNQKVQDIYNDKSIRKMANGLKSLLHEKIGYDVQVALLSCNTILDLTRIMRQISLLHWKHKLRPCLNEEEIEAIINLAENNEAVRVIGDTLLTYATVYYKKKEAVTIEEYSTKECTGTEGVSYSAK